MIFFIENENVWHAVLFKNRVLVVCIYIMQDLVTLILVNILQKGYFIGSFALFSKLEFKLWFVLSDEMIWLLKCCLVSYDLMQE